MKKKTDELDVFTRRALKVIKAIPEGKVLTYGRVALLAGKSRGARQVSRLLHSMSEKHELPWHRVINAQGRISLEPSRGYELQKALLEDEGVEFSLSGRVDLSAGLWQPDPAEQDRLRDPD